MTQPPQEEVEEVARATVDRVVTGALLHNVMPASASVKLRMAEFERMAEQVRLAIIEGAQIDRLRSAAPAAEGWRPIETAPKDGSHILAWPVWGSPHEVAEVHWLEKRRVRYWAVPFGPACPREPTHWRPIPSPPKDETHG